MGIPNQFGDNDNPTGRQGTGEGPDVTSSLVSWCMSKVQRARQVRDEKYAKRWEEYTRLWRGFWSEEDKSTNSERSKLISPALAQSIEMAAADIEEALFSRIAWFDITDDIRDEEKDDAIAYRDQLLEDFELAGVPDSIAKSVLLGAIYGTGIAKVNVVLDEQKSIVDGQVVVDERPLVVVEPIRPDEFVIDPSATSVDEALFCAHEFVKPLFSIKEKQRKGVYKKADVGPWSGRRGDTTGLGTTSHVDVADDGVLITEYYGKVPKQFVSGTTEEDGPMVEAIVTIANETALLRAIKSPFWMGDRPVVAYQHDTIPGEFWGRGVSEKGYNPAKALDAELRARIDALSLMTAPILGADITRMPRNPDMKIRPGKIFMTRGRPSEVIEAIGFNPTALGATFQQAGDLERMIQMATGSMDSASPLSTNRRNETMGGMSMIQAGVLKRSKRTMQNLERQFLNPLIRRSLWRYMQFDSDRYPQDIKFKVRSAMGIMAKEVESSQLVQMLGFTEPKSPEHKLIIKALFDNSVSSDKQALKSAVDAILAPPDEQEVQAQKELQQVQAGLAKAELAKTQAEAEEAEANALLAKAKAKRELVLADLEDDKVNLMAAQTAVGAEKVRSSDRAAVLSAKVNMFKAKQKPQTSAKKGST